MSVTRQVQMHIKTFTKDPAFEANLIHKRIKKAIINFLNNFPYMRFDFYYDTIYKNGNLLDHYICLYFTNEEIENHSNKCKLIFAINTGEMHFITEDQIKKEVEKETDIFIKSHTTFKKSMFMSPYDVDVIYADSEPYLVYVTLLFREEQPSTDIYFKKAKEMLFDPVSKEYNKKLNRAIEYEKVNKENRISKEGYYLGIADAVSRRSTCIRRRYGAVLVKNDVIIATGYNGSPRGEENCCDTKKCYREEHNIPHGEQYEKCTAVHAEQNALLQAGKEAAGSTLYLVCFDKNWERILDPSPCDICKRLLKNAGVNESIVTYNTYLSKEYGKIKIYMNTNYGLT